MFTPPFIPLGGPLPGHMMHPGYPPHFGAFPGGPPLMSGQFRGGPPPFPVPHFQGPPILPNQIPRGGPIPQPTPTIQSQPGGSSPPHQEVSPFSRGGIPTQQVSTPTLPSAQGSLQGPSFARGGPLSQPQPFSRGGSPILPGQGPQQFNNRGGPTSQPYQLQPTQSPQLGQQRPLFPISNFQEQKQEVKLQVDPVDDKVHMIYDDPDISMEEKRALLEQYTFVKEAQRKVNMLDQNIESRIQAITSNKR